MRVRVRHQSRYSYAQPALLGPHAIRLHPAAHARAKLLSYDLAIAPACEVRWQQDPSGNRIARATFAAGAPTRELAVTVELSLDIRPVNPFDFFVEDDAKQVPFRYPAHLAAELAPYTALPGGAVPGGEAELGPRTRELIASLPATGYVTEWLVEVNRLIAAAVRYVIRDEAGIQTSEETLAKGSGSCRDSARLLVDVLRARGLAARFVSGYLVQLADEGDIPGETKGVARDVVDLHAWAEVFVPGAGWLGLDGTSGLLCGEGHVPLACTAEPALAAPIDGTTSAVETSIGFSMDIARLGFEPSPKRPYTDAQWDALKAAGDRVDLALDRAGVMLTMGGEPTWVSREHPHEPEWNTDALGPTKWDAGVAMARELGPRLGGAGGLTMHRMGKHYPGESLPRWALHLMWRKDGAPIWHDPRRLALPGSQSDSQEADGALGPSDAEALLRAIARRLGIEVEPIAGHEDPWIHLAEEQNLPTDVDPLKAGLDDPERRRTLARVLGRGLATPVGYALPIGREPAASGEAGRWLASSWTFRRGGMFLVPGDSPMGLRLPLDRVNGVAPTAFDRDPTTLRDTTFARQSPALQSPGSSTRAAPGEPEEVLRTALCTEVRDGILHVFVPPLPGAKAWSSCARSRCRPTKRPVNRYEMEGWFWT